MATQLNFKRSLSCRNKPILVVNDSYIFNFICQNKKSKNEIFKCKDYKSKYYCLAYIHLNDDKIVKANNEHNHNIDHQKILLEEAKVALKSEIKKSIDPFSINLQKNGKKLFSGQRY